MAYRIVWSEAALADLRDLVRYIARDDRKIAKRFGDSIVNKVESLQVFQRIGRMLPEYREDHLRELIQELPLRTCAPALPSKLTLYAICVCSMHGYENHLRGYRSIPASQQGADFAQGILLASDQARAVASTSENGWRSPESAGSLADCFRGGDPSIG